MEEVTLILGLLKMLSGHSLRLEICIYKFTTAVGIVVFAAKGKTD